jgi:hypothetical protein
MAPTGDNSNNASKCIEVPLLDRIAARHNISWHVSMFVSKIRSFQVCMAIGTSLDLLEQFPHSGRATYIADVRVLPVATYPYLVYHTVTDAEVIIVHIRHAARAPATTDDF